MFWYQPIIRLSRPVLSLIIITILDDAKRNAKLNNSQFQIEKQIIDNYPPSKGFGTILVFENLANWHFFQFSSFC